MSRFRISLDLTQSRDITLDRYYNASTAEEAEQLAISDVSWDLEEGSITFENWSVDTGTRHDVMINDIMMVDHNYTAYSGYNGPEASTYIPYISATYSTTNTEMYAPYELGDRIS